MTHRPAFRSLYKDGWSPEAMVHVAHLRAIIDIRQPIFGQVRRKKWIVNNNKKYNTYGYDIRQHG